MLYLNVQINDKPDFILNSIQRTGNTFLSVCFRNAIDLNYPDGYRQFVEDYNFYHHTHSPILLKMPERADLFQFTTFRKPEELMPSLFVFNVTMQQSDAGLSEELDDLMDSLIKDYIKYLSYALGNESVKVLLFEDVVQDTHRVLENMLGAIKVEYKTLVDIDRSKKTIEDINLKRYTTEELYMKNHHLPRGIESTYSYDVAKKVFDRAPMKNNLIKLYSELIKNRAV